MFKIIRNMKQLDFGQLMSVYQQSNMENGKIEFPFLDSGQQMLEAEQAHYAFLQEFFKITDSFLAVWIVAGKYRCALRMEPYRDGFLLEGLETEPDSRNRGYAKALIRETERYLFQKHIVYVYSHIHKKNMASVYVHRQCGFEEVSDHAVFVDGSANYKTYTFCKTIFQPEENDRSLPE